MDFNALSMPLVSFANKYNNFEMLVDFNWKGENCRGTYLWNLTQTNCGKLHNLGR
jgi:hypothetical protein